MQRDPAILRLAQIIISRNAIVQEIGSSV